MKMPRKKHKKSGTPPSGPANAGAAADVPQDIGPTRTLREFIATAPALNQDERGLVVDQALAMIEQVYVHLPLKRAMHAVDPVQRLRLLRQRLATYTERRFHDEMISIFTHLRDLHTN